MSNLKGDVNIGTAGSPAILKINGGVKLGDTSSVCDATNRGMMKFVAGGAGEADKMYYCIKDAAEVYAWAKTASSTIDVPSPVTVSHVNAGDNRYQPNINMWVYWSAPAANGSAITGYKVYRSTTSGGESLVPTGTCSGTINDTYCQDSNVFPGTTYYYKVSAVNGIGGSSLVGANESTATACYPASNSACSSPANNCGQTTTGYLLCNGTTCSATTAPANPAGYGTPCTTSANACGQTRSGIIGCDGSTCSVTTPPDSSCWISASVCSGISAVYATDAPGTYQWSSHSSNGGCVDGGRWPTATEAECVCSNSSSFGLTPYGQYDRYWTTTESDYGGNGAYANSIYLQFGCSYGAHIKSTSLRIRCVK